MSGEDKIDALLLTVIAFIIGVICYCVVHVALCVGELTIKDEAVKAGHAEYYLDGNNERQWRWRDIK